MKIIPLAVVLVSLPLWAASPTDAVMPTKELLAATAPAKFDVKFETTKGNFVVHSEREWAPLGVDRFYALVRCGYYNGAILYRVGPTMSFKGGRTVQWGLHGDPKVNQAWAGQTIKDEPAKRPHVRGSLNFARGEPHTRSVELAIILTASPEIDTVNYLGVVGFPSIGEITAGLEVAESFNAKYGNEPNGRSEKIAAEGSAFLDREYPGLDRIVSARIIAATSAAK